MKRLKSQAEQYIGQNFLRGDFSKSELIESQCEEVDIVIDELDVEMIISWAKDKFPPYDEEIDAAIAPRLHKAINISRKQANDYGFWRYLTIVKFKKFVRHRWSKEGEVTFSRYWGNKKKNALCRLWWAAELTVKDGNYDLTEKAFRHLVQDQIEWFLIGNQFSNLPIATEAVIETLLDEKRNIYRPVIRNFNRLLTTTVLESLKKDEIIAILSNLVEAQKKGQTPMISKLAFISGTG